MTKKSVICIRPTMPQEKNLERERRKYLEPKEYKVFKKKETARFREYRLKNNVKAIAGQHWNVNFKNNTNHVVNIFNKTNFELKCS